MHGFASIDDPQPPPGRHGKRQAGAFGCACGCGAAADAGEPPVRLDNQQLLELSAAWRARGEAGDRRALRVADALALVALRRAGRQRADRAAAARLAPPVTA